MVSLCVQCSKTLKEKKSGETIGGKPKIMVDCAKDSIRGRKIWKMRARKGNSRSRFRKTTFFLRHTNLVCLRKKAP